MRRISTLEHFFLMQILQKLDIPFLIVSFNIFSVYRWYFRQWMLFNLKQAQTSNISSILFPIWAEITGCNFLPVNDKLSINYPKIWTFWKRALVFRRTKSCVARNSRVTTFKIIISDSRTDVSIMLIFGPSSQNVSPSWTREFQLSNSILVD